MSSRRFRLASCAAALLAATGAAGQGSPQPRVLKDLEYAKVGSAGLLLDLYQPEGSGPHQLVVWIHGGAFRMGSKNGIWYRPITNQTQRGYAVASIDYRLSGQARFPALVHDAKAAIRWLRANAARYNLKADRIVAAGESAGGYLVTMLGTSGGVAELEGDLGNARESSRVQGVVDFFGPTDFLQMDAGARGCANPQPHSAPDSPESQLLGCNLRDCPDKVRAANPITYIGKDTPPFLILHGSADCTVPPNQSQLLYDALTKAGVKADLRLLPGLTHADRGFFPPQTDQLVSGFLDAVLRR